MNWQLCILVSNTIDTNQHLQNLITSFTNRRCSGKKTLSKLSTISLFNVRLIILRIIIHVESTITKDMILFVAGVQQVLAGSSKHAYYSNMS